MASVRQIIVDAAERYGVDPQAALAIAQLESSMDPTAQNPRSSAGGLFQFIDSTWDAYGGGNKFDPYRSADAGAQFMRDNQRRLERELGRKPSAGELYLAHQQGVGGALRLLRDPNQRAVDVVGHDEVVLNGGDPSMTAGQFVGLWDQKAQNAFGGAQNGTDAIAAAVPGLPPTRPNASAYSGSGGSLEAAFDPTPIQTQAEVLGRLPPERPQGLGTMGDAPTPPERPGVQTPRARPDVGNVSAAPSPQSPPRGLQESLQAPNPIARPTSLGGSANAPTPPYRPEEIGGDLVAPSPLARPDGLGNTAQPQGLQVPDDTAGYLKGRLENPGYDPGSDMSQFDSVYAAYQPTPQGDGLPPNDPANNSSSVVNSPVPLPNADPRVNVQLPNADPRGYGQVGPAPQATIASASTSPWDTALNIAGKVTGLSGPINFMRQPMADRTRQINDFFAGPSDRPAILSRAPVDRRSQLVSAVNNLGSQDTFLTRRDYRMRGDDDEEHSERSIRKTNREIVGGPLTRENLDRAAREGKTLVVPHRR